MYIMSPARSSSRIKVPALKVSFKEKQTQKMTMRAMKDHEKQLKENAAQEKQVITLYNHDQCHTIV